MKHFYSTLVILVLVVVSPIFAQTGKISGQVKDSRTGEPLIGVTIIVNGTTLGAASNEDGYFHILRVGPGTYSVKASYVGYHPSTATDVKVLINQTTELNFSLSSLSLETDEVTVIAKRPVVEKDVSASTVNISKEDFENLPIASIQNAVQLQAGIQSDLTIRGGGNDQTAFMLNGLSMKDERTNAPFVGVSMTSVAEIQIQTGGFNAEYGNIRSGLINAVSKEGNTDKYSFSLIARYRPAGNKSFEDGPSSRNFYYLRPYLDPSVAWTGTSSGAWGKGMQDQYPTFSGWNNYVLSASSPYKGLTPEAAQRLFLWQHRKDFKITKPDHELDMNLTGPVPGIGKMLGNLRFSLSFRETQTMLLMPLSTDDYYTNIFQGKLTSDIAEGMKLTLDGMVSKESGTAIYRDGSSGINSTLSHVANNNFSKGSDGESRIYTMDYWCPASTDRYMLGGKFTHTIDNNSFYEAILNVFGTDYKKAPGLRRDLSNIYEIIPGLYYTTEAPFGYEPLDATTGIGSGMRMGGGGMSYGRDTSSLTTTNFRIDYSNQIDKYHYLKAGFEFTYTDNQVNNGIADSALTSSNTVYYWRTFPIRGALYVQDKIEFEGMIANLGLRMDFLNPNTDWYAIPDVYDAAYSSKPPQSLESLKTEDVKAQVKFSPRVGVAFPITLESKLFFNYGHFLQIPTPDNLFLLRRDLYSSKVSQISDPSIAMQKTVAYELGYEQAFLDDFKVRVAGYYKDVTNETRLVTYQNKDASVSYTTPKTDLYEDIRGFEVSLTKSRGQWVTGFLNYTYSVRTYGYFNYPTYYQNASVARDYIRNFIDNAQRKPLPQPYARLNVDFFTPATDFGPELGGVEWLADWRLSVLASWSAGEYFTWTGGGTTIPGYQYNFQWSDNYGVDLRLSKSFKFGPVNMQLFADLFNVFNIKTMSRYYGWTENDFDNYMKSLHLPESDIADFKYPYISGSDKPGEYRNYDIPFTPMKGVVSLSGESSPYPDYIYFESSTGRYVQYVNNAWVDVDPAKISKIKKDKSYIDMPNLGFFSFLNPRNIYFGLKFSVELY